ncbi:MAG: M18 family aminopeptidase, partial [Spirochaetales bacterium]
GFTDVRSHADEADAFSSRSFLRLGRGAVLAFDPGDRSFSDGVTIVAAHTDSPALRIKEQAIKQKSGAIYAPIEIYGGPIRSTWLDRELSVVGITLLTSGEARLFRLPFSSVIPNAAIHLNREINEGFSYNPQDHLNAIMGAATGEDGSRTEAFFASVAESVSAAPEDLSVVEAYLAEPTRGSFLGFERSLFAAPRIDNLAGCFTNLRAFLDAPAGGPRALALYNHEEVGSQTGEGALSGQLDLLLERVFRASELTPQEAFKARERSLLVSNDATHGLHPSYVARYEPDYSPVLGGGPVVKINANYRYATTLDTHHAFASACRRAGVTLQRYSTRADQRSGSTVGPLSWGRTGVPSVDVGIPIWAMHSVRESAGTNDVLAMTQALSALLAGTS